jgi:hypothetical protein
MTVDGEEPLWVRGSQVPNVTLNPPMLAVLFLA